MSQSLPNPSPDSVLDTAGQIPLLDIGPYLAGVEGALDKAAVELRHALENIGFYYLVGHGVPQPLIDRIFAETKRFHALPLDRKMALKLNRSNNGYMPLKGHAQRHTSLNKDPKPNENESFFAKRERDPADPDVIAKRDLRDPNQWPDDLPGFKETVLEYQGVMRGLAHRLLPGLCAGIGAVRRLFLAYLSPGRRGHRAHDPLPAGDGGAGRRRGLRHRRAYRPQPVHHPGSGRHPGLADHAVRWDLDPGAADGRRFCRQPGRHAAALEQRPLLYRGPCQATP
jgi:hypothetical protein